MSKLNDALDILNEAQGLVALCFHAAQSPGLGEIGTAFGRGLNTVTERLDKVEVLLEDLRNETDAGGAK